MNVDYTDIKPVNLKGEHATFSNEKYGEHHRNNFDIWVVESASPTPLVIYIHGGGFVGGDKSKYYDSADLVRFLDAGISVAVINYRFMNESPYGILASMNDSKRCLQYIRYNSEKYNIDKNKIACTGGSAGAGTSLWLAFNDNMADLENEDPILRESSRLTCAGAFSTQSTYDICRWSELLGLPKKETAREKFEIARAFGFKSADNIDLLNETKVRGELDFLNHMNKNSSPFFVFNNQKSGFPTNEDELNHHPLHAKALKTKADEVGVEAIIYAPEIGIVDESGIDLVVFFLEKFNG
ncbi:MAG: alpha/beta hydrolase fold domain-containing protein [Draconibacterium sp.]|nr:alpha/beta hydrolase fold domain-containing protein [Draconibacterium sp.]